MTNRDERTLLLDAHGLTKVYPGIKALDDVDLALSAGRVHALVGENGAGKSTLIKILAGVVRADGGYLTLEGNPLEVRSPRDAREAGVAVVHQHAHLIPDLTVAENFALRRGYPRSGLGTIDWAAIRRSAQEAVRRLVPALDVRRLARFLSEVEQQLVELSFALAQAPRILILDEPTAVLPRHETELLFERVREFVEGGTAVVYISHRLEEVFEIADDVTVLRDGRRVWSKPCEETDHDELIRGMVGRSVSFERDPSSRSGDTIAFELASLSDAHGAFANIQLQIRAGEIYGIYGLVGAGQSELCHALFGLRDPAGEYRPPARGRGGFAYVPADRQSQGIFQQLSVGENLSLASLGTLSRRGLIESEREHDAVARQIHDLTIKTLGPTQGVTQLSGGNQQKVLLGRWLMTEPKVLLLEEPTQGVDVGAKGQIHSLVRALARGGVTVIVVSSEIPELVALCHRIGVMREGELVREFDGDSVAEEDLLRASLPESQKATREVSLSSDERSFPRRLLRFWATRREVGLAGLIVVLLLLFSTTIANYDRANILDVVENSSIVLVGALGMTMVIIAGGIDISIGAILGLAAIGAGKLAKADAPALLVCSVPLLIGSVLGSLNGFLTVVGRVHSIVITLGTLSIFRAVIIQVTGGYQLNNLPEQVTWIRRSSVAGVPMLVILAAVLVAGVHLFLRYSERGRTLYALGGSRSNAEYLGVRPSSVLPLAFGFSGVLAGFAGLMWAGRYGQVQTNVGQNFELAVIAAAVVGGTHIMGGRGTALGTVLGALFLGIVNNVLVLLNVSAFWERAIVGAMILLALVADAMATRLEARR